LYKSNTKTLILLTFYLQSLLEVAVFCIDK
jgi:hypothetical protein